MRRKFWKTDFRKLFYNKFYFFMSNLNVECFQLSFDIHIVHIGQKTTKFRKLQHRKLENFRGQSRLLRRHLTTKLCNLGMCSKALEVDNDASFHLRLCLVDLDKVQGRRFKRSAMCQFDPPPYYRLTKKPILIRVNPLQEGTR